MAKDIKRESLISALSYCSLRKLPNVDDGENIWLHALAKVVKASGQESYALFRRDNINETRMIKDFGDVSAVRQIVEFYPFEFLKANYVPKFKSTKKEERIAYLSKYDKNTDYSTYTAKQLDDAVINLGIKTQLKA